MNKWFSRKLIVTLITPGIVLFMQSHGVPEETIQWVLGLLAAYVGGQSLVDFGAMKNPTPKIFKTTVKPPDAA